jgi:drug/metabolite transporter (DMT)-like permease
VSSANRRGILALIAGMAIFSVNDVLMKFITLRFPVGEAIFIRGLMTIALMGGAVVVLGHLRHLRAAFTWPIILRSMCDALTVILFVIALVHMKLAELSAVFLTAPLILTALAACFYGETIGWRRWLAVACGFIGTLFVVRPTPAAFDGWALLGLGSALFTAFRDLITRRIEPGIPTTLVALMGLITMTFVALAMGSFEEWRPMPMNDVLLLAVAALFICAAFYLMVMAFRGAEVSVVAPFRYVFLLWAMVAGYVAFGEVPDRWSFVGAALIVAAGLYAIHRETVRRRSQRAQSAQKGGIPT